MVFFEEHEYRSWVCLGCETGRLEKSYRNSEWDEIESTFHPGREQKLRSLKKHYRAVGHTLRLWPAYKEVIDRFNANLPISCGVVLRALLEGICVDQGIPDKGKTRWLTSKLDALERKLERRGDLPPDVAEALRRLKTIGDDAAHRLRAMPRHELEQAIEFIENLIEYTYRIEYRRTLRRLANSSQILTSASGRPSDLPTE